MYPEMVEIFIPLHMLSMTVIAILCRVSTYLVSFQFQHSRNPFVNLASFVYQLRTFLSDVGTYSSSNKGFEMGIDM